MELIGNGGVHDQLAGTTSSYTCLDVAFKTIAVNVIHHSPSDTRLAHDGLDPMEEIPILRHSPAELIVNELNFDGLLRGGDERSLRCARPETRHESLSLSG